MTNFGLYLSAFSLFILILALAIFLRVSYKHRRLIETLRKQVKDYTQRSVENFLQREIQLTENLQRANTAEANSGPPNLERLRLFWLEAEFAALKDNGRRGSDQAVLQKRAQPLLRLTQPKTDKANPATKWDSAGAMEQLQKARAVITAKEESLSKHRQQVSSDSPAFSQGLDSVSSNNVNLLSTISRLEKELAALQDKLNVTSQRLAEAQQRSAAIDAGSGVENTANAAAIAEIERSYQQTLTEMQRMREINRNQRGLILQLEQELSNLRVDSVQYTAASSLVDQLKLQLRDYETCTVILEMEAESLRERLQQLGGAEQSEEIPKTEADAIIAPRASESPNAEDKTLNFVGEIALATDAHGIGRVLIDWLRGNGISAVLFIKQAAEPIWISSETAVDTHSKQLLQSIVPIPDRPLVDVDEGMVLAYPAARLLVYTNSALNDRNGELAQRLRVNTALVAHWLQLLAREQEITGDLKKRLTELLPQYDYMEVEHAAACDKFKQELKTFLSSSSISEVQRQVATGMLEDFEAEIEILGQVGTLIRRNIATMINGSDTAN